MKVLILFLITLSTFASSKNIIINGKKTNLKESNKYIAIKLQENKTLKEEFKDLSLPNIEDVKYLGKRIFLVKFKSNINKNIFINKDILKTYNSNNNWPVVSSNKIIVKFKNEISKNEQDKIMNKFNLKITHSFNYSNRAFILSTQEDALKVSNQLFNLNIFEYAYPNFYIKHEKYFTPNDPLYSHQWHLNGTNIATNGVNAEAAWDINMGNSNIKIAILDDGVDTTHEDLNVVESYDFNKNEIDTTNKGKYFNSANPQELCTDNTFLNCTFGYYEDGNGVRCENAPYNGCTFVESHDAHHGTACAGVAAANGNNNKGVTGLCMNCSILAYQILNSSGYSMADADIRAFEEAKIKADVISCSWGYPKSTGTLSSLNSALGDVINDVALTGRGGKGMPILFAAGNEGENFIPDSLPGLENVIAIGAINYKDKLTIYSNYGDNLFLVAPSNIGRAYGDEESIYSIWTTDITGNDGYNKLTNLEAPCDYTVQNCQSYTSTFGGTSSATPLVSGLIGLMLSQNNNLTLVQIKTILKNSAVKIPMIEEVDEYDLFANYCKDHPEKNYNSVGHSVCMGYGKIDALATMIAVRDLNLEPTCDGILCSGHGNCSLVSNQPKCNCENGFREVGLNCLEESGPCDGILCSGHGNCINNNGILSCECETGYNANNLECIATSCDGETCSNHGSCVNSNGFLFCECEDGFHNNELECISNGTSCSNIDCNGNGNCELSNSGNAYCSCNENYISDGLSCRFVCEGITCSNHGSCALIRDGDKIKEFCDCDLDFHEEGLSCISNIPVNPCMNVDCVNGICINDNNQAKCNCNNNYHAEGLTCVKDIEDPCVDVDCGEGTCVNDNNQAKCNCNNNYHAEGLKCVINNVEDPCQDVVCGEGDCKLENNKPKCECNNGYHVDENGTSCIKNIVQDFCKDVTCSNHGTCVINNGAAYCNCERNFRVNNNTECLPKKEKYNSSESCNYNKTNSSNFFFLFILFFAFIIKKRKNI